MSYKGMRVTGEKGKKGEGDELVGVDSEGRREENKQARDNSERRDGSRR